jgi:hypothetical protein
MTGISASAVMRSTEIAAKMASASCRLREALLSGGDTASIRRELADLDRQAMQLGAEQVEASDAEEARLAEQIEAGAKVLEADARTRVGSLIAALEIPPAPSSVGSPR